MELFIPTICSGGLPNISKTNIYKGVSIIIFMKKGLSKRTVTILVIIAVILVIFTVAYHVFDLGGKIPTESGEDLGEFSGGKVGIQILPSDIEDRGIGDEGVEENDLG